MRLIKIVLAGLVVLVIVAVGGYVPSARAAARDQEHQRGLVRGRLVELAGQRRPVAVAQLQAGRGRFAGLGRPVRSWSELSCIMDSRDAGIMVQGYEQTCHAAAVDVYATSLTLPEVLGTTGLAEDQVGIGTCPLITERISFVPVTGPVAAGSCQLLQSGADPTPVSRGRSALVQESRSPAARGSPVSAYLVVVVDDFEGQQVDDLGCDPWALLFCDPPRDGMVLP